MAEQVFDSPSPASLAAPVAEKWALGQLNDWAPDALLDELDKMADAFRFIGRAYIVETVRGLSLPAHIPEGQQVSVIQFAGLSFEGAFIGHSLVEMGRRVGRQAVHACCLTFDKVTLLPDFDKLPQGHFLYTPALGVNSMSHLG